MAKNRFSPVHFSFDSFQVEPAEAGKIREVANFLRSGGNGLILAHISPFFTQIVTGLIILAAIWLNTKVFSGGRRQ